MIKRMFWRLAYPFALAANNLKLCSYRWVNLGHGAWRRDLFNDLWHHQHFGDEIEWMPNFVVLCGIGYRVSVAEGLVTFINRDLIHKQMNFERDPHADAELWYFTGSGNLPASHIQQAYDWVKAVYGGSFDRKQLPLSNTVAQ